MKKGIKSVTAAFIAATLCTAPVMNVTTANADLPPGISYYDFNNDKKIDSNDAKIMKEYMDAWAEKDQETIDKLRASIDELHFCYIGGNYDGYKEGDFNRDGTINDDDYKMLEIAGIYYPSYYDYPDVHPNQLDFIENQKGGFVRGDANGNKVFDEFDVNALENWIEYHKSNPDAKPGIGPYVIFNRADYNGDRVLDENDVKAMKDALTKMNIEVTTTTTKATATTTTTATTTKPNSATTTTTTAPAIDLISVSVVSSKAEAGNTIEYVFPKGYVDLGATSSTGYARALGDIEFDVDIQGIEVSDKKVSFGSPASLENVYTFSCTMNIPESASGSFPYTLRVTKAYDVVGNDVTDKLPWTIYEDEIFVRPKLTSTTTNAAATTTTAPAKTTTKPTATTTTTAPTKIIIHEGEAFGALVSEPTKKEYKKGEKLSYSGMSLGIIKTTTFLTEQGEKTDIQNIAYDVEWIDPEFVSVIDSEGKSHNVSEFSSLPAGNYTIKLSKYVEFSSYEDHHSIKSIGGVDCSFNVKITNEPIPTTTTKPVVTTTTAPAKTTTKPAATTTTTEPEDILYGDTNLNGQVELSDAVLIMQSFANPDKYGTGGTATNRLTEEGKKRGDCCNTGDGLTNKDALAIQKYLLTLIDKLPFFEKK